MKRWEQKESNWPAIFYHEGPPVVIQASVPSTPGNNSVVELRADGEKVENTSEVRRLQDTIIELETQVESLKQAVSSANVGRKAMCEQIARLKGPVRVMCRVQPVRSARPLSLTYPERDLSETCLHTLSLHSPTLDFTCDRVFPEQCSQEEVFSEIAAYVQRVADGEPLTIVLHGASGSGKTYALEGQHLSPVITNDSGLIARAAVLLFAPGGPVKVSCLYIANDTLQDLVAAQSQKLSIKAGEAGVGVDLLSWHQVNSPGEMMEVLRIARERRGGDRRGHTVYQIVVDSSESRERRLNFVELAGFDTPPLSPQEAKFLYMSFSSLRKVIALRMGITPKQTGVVPPYRDCKLTRVLQDSLAHEKGKVLFFILISSSEEKASQTREALKYGVELQSCVV